MRRVCRKQELWRVLVLRNHRPEKNITARNGRRTLNISWIYFQVRHIASLVLSFSMQGLAYRGSKLSRRFNHPTFTPFTCKTEFDEAYSTLLYWKEKKSAWLFIWHMDMMYINTNTREARRTRTERKSTLWCLVSGIWFWILAYWYLASGLILILTWVW